MFLKVGSVEANKATVQQLTLDDIENLKSVVVSCNKIGICTLIKKANIMRLNT